MTEAPDWPPAASAYGLQEGYRRHGSTGQLFEVKNGQWVRVHDEELKDRAPNR